MTEWVTISTKVRKEVVEKARKYGINISEILRESLEKEIEKREEEEARKSSKRIAEELKLSAEEVVRLIREDRQR
ncbi:type II toxin-antitoxin system CcdA family antitoxin [Sulfurisphaera ohwakuensis]|uniref:Post-segregation antitoxin (Ccd killing protein) n=1 Tax=Sulfurisphaera ohwakuensis TaxID=69656 RepID=A0A650CI84_SULOH|nr:type II toxin-antitoxin system CcdA family antitoxin [Sulfurisphaera ohwakuensis]MBB5253842.1 post-segregation antitoxin (ccd killing protein) [Sulfurisphaera ohwakuensis]QGR17486.1 VapB-type antitoxin [Sulfurisphaera ohwakuensis]